ncbi:MAG: hypothetical protein ABSE49_22790 [Polyangiaceae bacterium]
MTRPPVLGCLAGVVATAAAACAPAVQAPSAWQPPPEPAPRAAAPPLPVTGQPDVELRDPRVAVVHGQSVPFDGIEEGLTWPALQKALGPHKAGDVVTLQVSRGVPIGDLLRAAWAVHAADVHVQSLDASGAMRAVELRAKRDGAPAVAGCHLAVFLQPNGTLRVAAPGGPREIGGDHAAATLARSLADERAKCPLKYVAFGAESDASPWGPVFDVLVAVDQEKSAGDARYVLGQAMHVTAR